MLIIDDWGLTPLKDSHRRDILEILEDRHGKVSTVITSQLPLSKWHGYIGEPTIADAILDRLVHSAYKCELKGTREGRQRPKTKHSTPSRRCAPIMMSETSDHDG